MQKFYILLSILAVILFVNCSEPSGNTSDDQNNIGSVVYEIYADIENDSSAGNCRGLVQFKTDDEFDPVTEDAVVTVNSKALSLTLTDYRDETLSSIAAGSNVQLEISHDDLSVDETLIMPESIKGLKIGATDLINNPSVYADPANDIVFTWDTVGYTDKPGLILIKILSDNTQSESEYYQVVETDDGTFTLPTNTLNTEASSWQLQFIGVNRKVLTGYSFTEDSYFSAANKTSITLNKVSG